MPKNLGEDAFPDPVSHFGFWIFHKTSKKTFHVSCFEHVMADTAEDGLVVDDKDVVICNIKYTTP